MSQMMWPTDVMSVGEVNDEVVPLHTTMNTRLCRVCGLAAQQRVSLILQGFNDLTKNEKDELFKNSIQAYIQYLEEMKQKGRKVAMKIISHVWRSYKSKVVMIWRNQDTPFCKYKDVTKEDWVRFIEKCESEHFVMESQYMQWLRSQNELDHHLDNTGYARKQRKWQQEDEKLAQQDLENPYDKFCGWLEPFMRARSKLTESGDASFYNQSTSEVAQRVLRESSEDSNGER
jgi:hypothetical protein